MNQETPAGRDVKLMRDAAAYDAAVKRLLSHKPFLARIMKECLAEYHDCSLEDIMNRYIEGDPHVADVGVDVDESQARIRGGNTEDKTLTEGTIFYDIRFNALAPRGNELIGIIINVEAQNNRKPGYSLLKRAIYYCSRLISAQKGVEFTHSDYDRIKKVYSIWVCSNLAEGEEPSITVYHMKEEHLAGRVEKDPAEYDLLSVIMIRLDDVPRREDGSVAEEALNKGVLGMLGVLLKGQLPAEEKRDILEAHYGIEMTERIDKEVKEMCNLSQDILEEGLEKGIEKGFEKGIEKGVSIGADRSRVESLRALMESMSLTLEQAMRALKYPMEDMEKFAAALNG